MKTKRLFFARKQGAIHKWMKRKDGDFDRRKLGEVPRLPDCRSGQAPFVGKQERSFDLLLSLRTEILIGFLVKP